MMALRLFFQHISDKFEEWQHDRLFAAWRAQRLARRH
jgi:hypothetical protein